MGQFCCNRPDGCRLRYVPAGAWHRHDSHGRIFPLRKQSLHCYAVYGLGNPLPHHGLAIIPNIRWAGYRCGKSVVIDWQKRIVCIVDRLFQTNLLNVSRHRHSTLYSPDGYPDDRRRFHFCGCGSDADERTNVADCNDIRRRTIAPRYFGDCIGLELFQASA